MPFVRGVALMGCGRGCRGLHVCSAWRGWLRAKSNADPLESAIRGPRATHIVVGAGSAGCVLANRLSESASNRVVLLEAGPEDHLWNWKIHMPAALMYNLCDDTYNWDYNTTPQEQMNGRTVYWPRGRVWGGSSVLNAMVYVRGHPLDYDRWEREGARGWTFENCLPYFKKSECHSSSSGPSDPYRGHCGPLHVQKAACENPLHGAFIAAGQQAELGYTSDMNGFRQEGVGRMDMTVHEGVRCSTSRAFLRPALKRENLLATSGVLVTRVIFENGRAVGVEVVRKPSFSSSTPLRKSDCRRIYADGPIVIAGGAINSPQLLMLSGVGPAEHLKANNIEVVCDLPGVGQNLLDHLEVYVQQKCRLPITLYSKSSWRYPHNVIKVGVEWLLLHRGLGASSHLESGGFTRSSSRVKHPDIQFHFLPSTVHDDGRTGGSCHAYQVHVGPLRSKARGELRLRSGDPRDAPVIDPRYLSHPDDIVEFRKCIRLSREIFAQRAFDAYRGAELAPGSDCQTDAQIDAFVREKAASAYHPAGTCKMGRESDAGAVVDGLTMSVHGVENLKVVDASVMPSIVSGNLNGPVIMIAERAADLIQGKPTLPPESPPIWDVSNAAQCSASS